MATKKVVKVDPLKKKVEELKFQLEQSESANRYMDRIIGDRNKTIEDLKHENKENESRWMERCMALENEGRRNFHLLRVFAGDTTLEIESEKECDRCTPHRGF